LYVLIEQVASEDLLSVFEIDLIGKEEQESKSSLCHKLQIFIVEKDVVIVKEQELFRIS
jgi:hypothetical protein